MIPDNIRPERRPSARNRGGTQFEIQAALIPQKNRFQYQSPAALARTIKSIIDSKAAEEYFIYIQGIGEDKFDKMETRLRKARLRRFVLLTFENALCAAIMHIRPTVYENRVSLNLFTRLITKISLTPAYAGGPIAGLLVPLGDIPGVRSKEGDHALVPATREEDVWPAVVIDVCNSQGLDYLRSDAKWWLINSAGQTRFVIIVQVTRNPAAFHFECWKMIPSGRRQTRQTCAWTPGRVHDCDIDEKGVVVSASSELRIPYDFFLDEPPDNASDAVLTNAELSRFALSMLPGLYPQ